MSMLELDPSLSEQMADIGQELANDFLRELRMGKIGRAVQFLTLDSDAHHAQHAAFLGVIGPEAIIDNDIRPARFMTRDQVIEEVQVIKYSGDAIIIRSPILACSLSKASQPTDIDMTIAIGWNYRIVETEELLLT